MLNKNRTEGVVFCKNCRQHGKEIGKGVLVEITVITELTAKVKRPIKFVTVRNKCDYCGTESCTREQNLKNEISMHTARREYNERHAHPSDDAEPA